MDNKIKEPSRKKEIISFPNDDVFYELEKWLVKRTNASIEEHFKSETIQDKTRTGTKITAFKQTLNYLRKHSKK